MGILTRIIHNDRYPFKLTQHRVDLRAMVRAYYKEFVRQIERIRVLSSSSPLDSTVAALQQRMHHAAIAATLITSWVIISSTQDSEYMGDIPAQHETIHSWLRGNYNSKSAPMNKCENTVALITSSLKVRRINIANCQFEVVSTFEAPALATAEFNTWMSEILRFDGQNFAAIPITAKEANAAYVAFALFKEQICGIPITSVTGAGEGSLWSLYGIKNAGILKRIFVSFPCDPSTLDIQAGAYFRSFHDNISPGFIQLAAEADLDNYSEYDELHCTLRPYRWMANTTTVYPEEPLMKLIAKPTISYYPLVLKSTTVDSMGYSNEMPLAITQGIFNAETKKTDGNESSQMNSSSDIKYKRGEPNSESKPSGIPAQTSGQDTPAATKESK